MKIKAFLVILLNLSMANLFHAQNLVPNSSFELFDTCPNTIAQINYLSNWFSANTATPDYYNSCSSGFSGVPNNVAGYQVTNTGNAYVGITFYNAATTNSLREYVEVKLIDTLKPNVSYCVSINVSLGNISKYTTSNIQAYFSEQLVFSNNMNPLNLTPQISNPLVNIISDTANWVLVSGYFIANGGEDYLIIGNFQDNMNSTIDSITGNVQPDAYYYIDDVSVINCNDTLSSVNEINQQYDVKLYPNPNNGTFTIECSAFETGKAILNIYDVTGKKIAEHLVNSKNKSLTINENNLDAGVYYYQIMVNDKTIKADKLVIIK